MKLKVIPEPAPKTRAVLVQENSSDPFPYFRGAEPSSPDMVCGSCGTVLATAFPRSSIGNVVMKCGRCGAFNDATDLAVH